MGKYIKFAAAFLAGYLAHGAVAYLAGQEGKHYATPFNEVDTEGLDWDGDWEE